MTANRPQAPRFLCLVLIGLGVSCYLITAAIDVWYGSSTTVSETGSRIQFLSMLLVSGFTFTFLCLAGALYRNGAIKASVALFVPTAFFIAYSATNGVGFVATETIGKTRHQAAQAKQAKDAVEINNGQLLAGRREVVDWLKSTYTTKASNTDKDRIIEKVTEAAMAPLPLQVAKPETALADAKAEVISKYLNWDIESVQITNALWLVLLLLMGKTFGPSLGFAFWPGSKDPGVQPMFKAPKSEGKPSLADVRPKLSKRAAYNDLKAMLANGGKIESQASLARKWGVSAPTVHIWLSEWGVTREPSTTAFGRRNAITSLNGAHGRAQ